jgi:hypothetical protein
MYDTILQDVCITFTPEVPQALGGEWQDLPHVVMTSDVEWDPSVLDDIISTKPNWYASIKPKPREMSSPTPSMT